MGVALLMMRTPGDKVLPWIACLLAAGLLVFSGSLYLLALTGATWLGALTPLGGAAFIAGWLWLGWWAWRL
jgi:uncharacterized membrane protein YgdD (TMEM256/DUF423 family)